jgi:hypothetical protein
VPFSAPNVWSVKITSTMPVTATNIIRSVSVTVRLSVRNF